MFEEAEGRSCRDRSRHGRWRPRVSRPWSSCCSRSTPGRAVNAAGAPGDRGWQALESRPLDPPERLLAGPQRAPLLVRRTRFDARNADVPRRSRACFGTDADPPGPRRDRPRRASGSDRTSESGSTRDDRCGPCRPPPWYSSPTRPRRVPIHHSSRSRRTPCSESIVGFNARRLSPPSSGIFAADGGSGTRMPRSITCLGCGRTLASRWNLN